MLTANDEITAETAASLLRANGIPTRVARDGAFTGIFGLSSIGDYALWVPEAQWAEARRLLDVPDEEHPEPALLRRFILTFAGILLLLLVVALLAAR